MMNGAAALEAINNGIYVRRPTMDNTLYLYLDKTNRELMSVALSGSKRDRQLQNDDLFATDWEIVRPADLKALKAKLKADHALHPNDLD